MTEQGRSGGGAARPVAARGVSSVSRSSSVSSRACKHVMLVRSVTSSFYSGTIFSEGRLLVEIVIWPMQVVHALRDDHSLCIAPWSFADPVTRIYGTRAGSAEVRMPGMPAGSGCLRKILTSFVSSG